MKKLLLIVLLMVAQSFLIAAVLPSIAGRWIRTDSVYRLTINANGNLVFINTQSGTQYTGMAYQKDNYTFVMSYSDGVNSFGETCVLSGQQLNCSWYGINIKSYGTETFNLINHPPTDPIGFIDSASTTNVSGWACDPDVPLTSIQVHLYFGGAAGCNVGVDCTVVQVTANIASELAVNNLCGGGTAHRFSYSIPSSILNFLGYGPHSVYAYGINDDGTPNNPLLQGAPKTINVPLSMFITPFIGQWILTDSSYMLNVASNGNIIFWDTIYGTKYTGNIIRAHDNVISMVASNSSYAFLETCTLVQANPPLINCTWNGTNGYAGSGSETYQGFSSIPFLQTGQSFSIAPNMMAVNYNGLEVYSGNRQAANLVLSQSAQILRGTYSRTATLNVILKATGPSSFIMFTSTGDGSYFSKDNCVLSYNNPVKFSCSWLDSGNVSGTEIFNQIINGQVTDVEGRTYNTVKIGSQWWMAENLKVAKFNNGDTILNPNSKNAWNSARAIQLPSWVNYGWNPQNETLYGKIYNWFAVNDNRGLCPAGWHVPNETDFRILASFADSLYTDPNASQWNITNQEMTWMGTDVGINLRSRDLWTDGGISGLDLYGFNFRPGGYKRAIVYQYCDFYGGDNGQNSDLCNIDSKTGQQYPNVRGYGWFWLSTPSSLLPNYGYVIALSGGILNLTHQSVVFDETKGEAFYVRCIKNP